MSKTCSVGEIENDRKIVSFMVKNFSVNLTVFTSRRMKPERTHEAFLTIFLLANGSRGGKQDNPLLLLHVDGL